LLFFIGQQFSLGSVTNDTPFYYSLLAYYNNIEASITNPVVLLFLFTLLTSILVHVALAPVGTLDDEGTAVQIELTATRLVARCAPEKASSPLKANVGTQCTD
jgi:hypothetical protein